ncbi:hypothetical protein CRUP_004076, partial [Coryphaenoides rupestris]
SSQETLNSFQRLHPVQALQRRLQPSTQEGLSRQPHPAEVVGAELGQSLGRLLLLALLLPHQ